MRLNVGCEIEVKADADCPVVAMLRPRSGQAQWLHSERYVFSPWVRTTEHIDGFGNLCQRLIVPEGTMQIKVEAVVETDEDISIDFNAPADPIGQLPEEVLQYLLPSRYCPSDKVWERASNVAGELPPGYQQVEAIRKWINENIEYRYGTSDASTDALETLAKGVGVCRDFSHIGISLCRSLQIPARMVVGYLHELDPMDLHAWFEAFIGGRWYTFDATQSEAKGGRVVLAYGRDAADVAFITNYGPLETTQMRVWVEEVTAES